MAAFDDKKKELDEKYDRARMDQLEEWVPGTKAIEPLPESTELDVSNQEYDENSLAIISEIDDMEKKYHEEYEKVYSKDKEANRDLNVLALEELKQANYFFAYLRSQERLYNLERQRKSKEPDEESTASPAELKRDQILDGKD